MASYTQKPIILDETGKQIANSILEQGTKLEELLDRYTEFIGSSADTNGVSGLVPAPPAGTEERFLSSNARWVVPSSISSIKTTVSSVVTEHPILLHSTASAGGNSTIDSAIFTSGVYVIPSSKSLKVGGTLTALTVNASTGSIDTFSTKGVTINGDMSQTGNTNIIGNFFVSNAGDFGGVVTSAGITTGECSASKVISSGEVVGQTHLRVAAANKIPDLIIRNDGTDIYFLFSDYANGTWNSLRPLTMNISSGNLTSSGTFTALKVYNAVWNDYAEFFPRGEETEVGDFVALSLDFDAEVYVKASYTTSKAVGIHSETFGHLIGGETPQNGEDFVAYNLPKYIPVGLVGRCYAKIQGTIDKGDFVVISNVPGVGRRFDKDTDSPLDVIGMAVESSADEEIKLVKVKVGN